MPTLNLCSPHTRGSVGAPVHRGRDVRVLPAHAGVSRFLVCTPPGRSSAPRTRGGQSMGFPRLWGFQECSPHTRGSVDTEDPALRCVEVLPAHAGVSRLPSVLWLASHECSPHTRGSVVRSCLFAGSTRYPCSPHTRGSVVRSSRQPDTRAPRTRGGQSTSDARLLGDRCSPHTRGSVAAGRGSRVCGVVLPAHAGVSRTSPTGRSGRGRAPRTRGGQSGYPDNLGYAAGCSPHTRGSVDLCAGRRMGHVVLPAHAGVSRTMRTWPPSESAVLPAHAGVSRHHRGQTLPLRPWRAPRTRGGQSEFDSQRLRPTTTSAPRTRGGQSTHAVRKQRIAPRLCSPHTRGSVSAAAP